MTDKELINEAKKARDMAYAPYSHFSVGAAILADNGRVFCGCNVESASYGACVCAERAAACAAVLGNAKRFVKIAVISNGDDFCMPCGICRQMLLEFGEDMEVICAKKNGDAKTYKLSELIPNGFGSRHFTGKEK